MTSNIPYSNSVFTFLQVILDKGVTISDLLTYTAVGEANYGQKIAK